jgi:hypothetical protein
MFGHRTAGDWKQGFLIADSCTFYQIVSFEGEKIKEE